MTSLVCKYVLFCARYYRRKCRKCPRIVKYSFAQRGCQKGNFWAIVNRTITHFTPQRIPLIEHKDSSLPHLHIPVCLHVTVLVLQHGHIPQEKLCDNHPHTQLCSTAVTSWCRRYTFVPSLTSPCTVPGVQVQWNKNDKWKELGTLLVWEIHCVWVTCSIGQQETLAHLP